MPLFKGEENMNWKETVDVNKFVREGNPDNFKEIAQKIYNELENKPSFKDCEAVSRLPAVESADEFDRIWEEIYDFADENRIWLGL